MTGRIVVVGSYNVGLTVVAPTIPRPGETVLGSAFHMGPGGKGSNQAIGVRRLGGDVRFVCRVGDDVFGREALALFEREGLDAHAIVDADEATGAGIITVDAAGQNAISVAPGANGRLGPGDLPEGWFEGVAFLLVQLETPVPTIAAAAAAARAAGAQVVLNPAPAAALSDDVLALVDVLTPNETELATLSGRPVEDPAGAAEAAGALRRSGAHVVVTLGAAGALWVSDQGVEEVPGVSVADVVDTTGAGDAFNAGLVTALAEGAPMREAVAFANRCGAFCVTRAGVIDGLGRRADVEALG